jgi:GT2 family glycosyltransferase
MAIRRSSRGTQLPSHQYQEKTMVLEHTPEQMTAHDQAHEGSSIDPRDPAEQIAQLRRELQAKNDENDHTQAELAYVRADLESALRVNAEILGSTVWRIARPVRWLVRRMRAAVTVFRAYRQSRRDGLRHGEVAGKLWRVVRQGQFRLLKAKLLAVAAGAPFGGVDATYIEWTRRYDELDAARLGILSTHAQMLPRQPTISVVMPVYNAPEPLLREAIESVLAQIYPHWELCIADDASPSTHVRLILDEYVRRDQRIRVSYRAENGHISRASNTAIEMARGEYVAFLDHDDLLRPHALACVAAAVNQFPEARVLYSDEDKLNAEGRRCEPYFKTAFSPDLLRSHNYMCHLAVYRRDFLLPLGGLRVGFEGAQDYDLVLRAVEHASPSQIVHIPRVLYHWRKVEGSTAAGKDQKPYALRAALRAVNAHLERTGLTGEAVESPECPGMVRVRYRVPEPRPFVSLIIPTRNTLELLRGCVESVRTRTEYAPYEILIVDNGSDDPATLAYFRQLESKGQARVVRDDGAFNFSRINNQAVKAARGAVLLFLNNDIEVISRDWLGEMVSHAVRPGVGAVGARLWYPNDTLQHGGVILVCGVAGHAHKGLQAGDGGYCSRAALIQNFSGVTGACLAVRREIFEEVGGFDETLAAAFNDVDFCLRVAGAGYRNVWTPYAELYHHESATRGHENSPEKRARFQKEAALLQARWGEALQADPYLNPNLSAESEALSLAFPPSVEPDQLNGARAGAAR